MERELKLAHTIFRSGWCRHLEAMVMRGGKWSAVDFPARWLLLEHPQHGPMVVDTGYAQRVLDACRHWPFSIYARMTPMFMPPEEACVLQLERHGIAASDVRHVIITHFHADHLGGLKDFPNATFHASKEAWKSVRHLQGFAALRKAFIPSLLPENFESRLELFDLKPPRASSPRPLPELEGIDILGDGTVKAIPLPGHAKGQFGVYFEGLEGPVLWAADAAWRHETIRQKKKPKRIAGIVMDSWTEFVQTVEMLSQLEGVEILLCHDDRAPAEVRELS